MTTPSEARRRLAALMDERRLDLRLTWQDVAEQGDVSLRALANARTGDSEIRPLTQRGIEAGLRWEPGSVGQVLKGGYPVPLDAHPAADPLFTAQAEAAMAPHLAPIRAAIAAAEDRHPGKPLTGALIFPRDPKSAETWDLLAKIGWGLDGTAKLLAIMRDDAAKKAATQGSSAAGLTLVQPQRATAARGA